MNPNKLETLQCGRAFAAILVLLFHTNITLSLKKYMGQDVFYFSNIGYSGVHFFFVLSGFVIYLTHAKDIGVPGRWRNYLKKRFLRIYLPLWTVLLCLISIFLTVPVYGSGTETQIKNIVSSMLALPSYDNSILSVEWTLRHELLFYIFFALLIAAPKTGKLIMCTWFVISCFPFSNNTMLGFSFSPYHLLFAMGILTAFVYDREPIKFPLLVLIVGGAIFFANWISCLNAGYRGPGPHPNPMAEWAFGIGSAFIILGTATLEKGGRLVCPASLVFLGEASYSIYLVHFPIVSMGAKIVAKCRHFLSSGIAYTLVVVLAISAGIAFHIIVERPIMRWARRFG